LPLWKAFHNGKTHLSIALGVEATKRRLRVQFVKAAELVRELLEARDDRVLTRVHNRMRRVNLLIIDELGFVPFDRAGGEVLFNLISDRYERRSTALLDRLGHHAHIITTKGASYRTQKQRTRARELKTEGNQ